MSNFAFRENPTNLERTCSRTFAGDAFLLGPYAIHHIIELFFRQILLLCSDNFELEAKSA